MPKPWPSACQKAFSPSKTWKPVRTASVLTCSVASPQGRIAPRA